MSLDLKNYRHLVINDRLQESQDIFKISEYFCGLKTKL